MVLAKHHCPSFPPGLCSCLWAFSHSVWCPCSRNVRVEAHLFSRQPQKEVAACSSAVTGCTGAGDVPRALLLQQLLALPAPAEPKQAPPGRNRPGPDGNLAPTHRPGPCRLLGSAAVVGEAARPPPQSLWTGQGCAHSQQPSHAGKDHRTRSMTCEPSTLASSCDPRDPISSL